MKRVSDCVFVDACRTVWLSSLLEVRWLGVVVNSGYLGSKTRQMGERRERDDREKRRWK